MKRCVEALTYDTSTNTRVLVLVVVLLLRKDRPKLFCLADFQFNITNTTNKNDSNQHSISPLARIHPDLERV